MARSESVTAVTPATNTAISAPYRTSTLPLTSVNHISFAVPQPQETAIFFQKVLGFVRLPRPAAFENSFDGAWVCGMGLEIHFIKPRNANARRVRQIPRDGIDPRNDHLSFLCKWDDSGNSDYDIVKNTLVQCQVEVLERDFPQDDLKQLFFCDPTSGLLIEISTNPKC